MDFSIAISTDGKATGQMTFDPAAHNNLINNIYLSLKIEQDSWWYDQTFGSRLHLLKKNTPGNADLAIQYGKEALQWILDAGKAASIGVTAERDLPENPGRLKLLIEAVEPDGTPVSFSYFVEVV